MKQEIGPHWAGTMRKTFQRIVKAVESSLMPYVGMVKLSKKARKRTKLSREQAYFFTDKTFAAMWCPLKLEFFDIGSSESTIWSPVNMREYKLPSPMKLVEGIVDKPGGTAYIDFDPTFGECLDKMSKIVVCGRHLYPMVKFFEKDGKLALFPDPIKEGMWHDARATLKEGTEIPKGFSACFQAKQLSLVTYGFSGTMAVRSNHLPTEIWDTRDDVGGFYALVMPFVSPSVKEDRGRRIGLL